MEENAYRNQIERLRNAYYEAKVAEFIEELTIAQVALMFTQTQLRELLLAPEKLALELEETVEFI